MQKDRKCCRVLGTGEEDWDGRVIGIPNEFPSEARLKKFGVQGSHSASGKDQAADPQVRFLSLGYQSAGAQTSRPALTPEVHTGGRCIEIYCREDSGSPPAQGHCPRSSSAPHSPLYL